MAFRVLVTINVSHKSSGKRSESKGKKENKGLKHPYNLLISESNWAQAIKRTVGIYVLCTETLLCLAVNPKCNKKINAICHGCF